MSLLRVQFRRRNARIRGEAEENLEGEDLKIQKEGAVALITGNDAIADPEALLELAIQARYETGADKLAIEKSMLADLFFILSTGIAGEALQKLINYQFKIAIYGDYSRYTSKPLKDFIRESNRGKDVFFVATQEESIERLGKH